MSSEQAQISTEPQVIPFNIYSETNKLPLTYPKSQASEPNLTVRQKLPCKFLVKIQTCTSKLIMTNKIKETVKGVNELEMQKIRVRKYYKRDLQR